MNVLLLTLVLGLAHADQLSSIEGTLGHQYQQKTRWNTIYLTANREEMIAENGPLRIYLRDIDWLLNGDLNVTFYIRVNCTCRRFRVHAVRSEEVWFSMHYSGKCYFYIKQIMSAHMIYLVNISEDADVTFMMLAFGRMSSYSGENEKAELSG
uniref:female-specific lacrimal gland protein-like isoform X2 n=1 Tax=Jaculus jaculus TaxID=51337 RepID=UPI001E1B4988|nr:female-specific lacrimal gland protein-like isoform X2 [Jaculus jaculus]